MSYIVLARKYRPSNFDEIIGQEHISDILSNAIKSKKVAHAYLFCGPRGIGKTSCARILAKALNCKEGPTIKPCDECSSCKEIAKSNSFDVIEIDGASNRGIDEIRTLRENVKFAPSYGNFKIYIVDEVHMLTTEAFNALLKTLEEPPEHVKFIFATTAPNKVPLTIISRCQKFDFKRIPIKKIVEYLNFVCKKEKLKIDQEALYAISKAAGGSMRDALSILDQLSSLSDKGIDEEDVYSMLGLVETKFLFDLSDTIGDKSTSKAFKILEQINEKGKDIKQLQKDIIEHFRNLMIIKVGGKSLGRLIDYPVANKEMLLTQCDKFTLKEILNAIDVFIGAQETARITESARMPIEVAITKLTYSEEKKDIPKESKVKEAQKPVNQEPPANIIMNKKGAVIVTKKEGENDISDKDDKAVTIDEISKKWDSLTHGISKEKMSIATYLQEGTPTRINGNELIIGFPGNLAFYKDTLDDQQYKEYVQNKISDKMGVNISVKYEIIDLVKVKEEPIVKSTLDKFKGEVVNRWHND